MNIADFVASLTTAEQEWLIGWFDGDVHDEKSREASAINNEGLEAQLKYLRERGWEELNEKAREALEEME